ncbi:BnaC05g28720D [Brassica napus]|uniref:BnaC05g28720D protein n=3 Tax=Brassica TaxID=3705 RepID=A0A078H4G9_BRANA|nr:BnaC05g28720D [Brassica napus]
MLKRRKVKDRETRLKLACLAITSSVLLPSSHTPRIIPEHVEISKDFDELLAYPWGRVPFKFLVTNLLSKDKVSLSQSSVALKGFVDAIQHVLIANVPVLKEEVIPNEPVVLDDSESDGEDEETRYDGSPDPQPPSEKPHVGKTPTSYPIINLPETMCQVDVRCITDDPHENWAEGVDFGWDDESVDELVDNMVRLIGEDFAFKKEMFIGGLTLAELGRLRALKKSKDKETSEKQEKDTIPESTEADTTRKSSK